MNVFLPEGVSFVPAFSLLFHSAKNMAPRGGKFLTSVLCHAVTVCHCVISFSWSPESPGSPESPSSLLASWPRPLGTWKCSRSSIRAVIINIVIILVIVIVAIPLWLSWSSPSPLSLSSFFPQTSLRSMTLQFS